MLVVPLAARASQRGVMLVADAPGHRFSEADRALASALGAELALALENAELYARVIAANADLGREQEKNIRKSRLAALGELSAVMAHEVRNPLGVIFNSLGSLRRLTAAPAATPACCSTSSARRPTGSTASSATCSTSRASSPPQLRRRTGSSRWSRRR